MRILFDHPDPFALAHGGFQIQIEQTRLALLAAGVEVEFLQWWNAQQKGDIIHFFGRPSPGYVKLAHAQGCKIVIGELLGGTGSRSRGELLMQRLLTDFIRHFMPAMIARRMAWESYRLANACIALTPWEAHLMNYIFGAPRERIHVVPNGVEEVFLTPAPVERGPWLVCMATLTERKRVLELAEAAVRAQTPVWVVGKPYSDSDSYAQRFLALARQHPQTIRYEGPIQDRSRLAEVYRAARGFVLLSSMETHSIAAQEAAACGCPLLLTDLPWARSVFGATASYCPVTHASATAVRLRAFYDHAPTLPIPLKPKSWLMVGQQLKAIYQAA